MKCPYCKSNYVDRYFDAWMPNILSACSADMIKNIKLFNFEASICHECKLGFNSAPLDDDDLKFVYDNYLYISPANGIGQSAYGSVFSTMKKYFDTNDKIMEIGCSDGFLLSTLKEQGFSNLIGIEPGPQADDARKRGLNVIKDYFSEKYTKEKYDGFILQHVFEHFTDPFEILIYLKKALKENGKIVIEVPNFTGYHLQHLFFYSFEFFGKMCKDNDLKIIECIEENWILRVVITKCNNENYPEVKCPHKRDLVEIAKKEYNNFNNEIVKINNLINDSEGNETYWWGAGTLSVKYLNQIDKEILSTNKIIVVDGDPNKFGLIIPGINLTVNPISTLYNKKIENLIISSSFINEINKTIKDNNINVSNTYIINQY